MQKQILAELQELKAIIAKLIGTADLPPNEQFSMEAINKAAKDFQRMEIQRGEWVKEDDISKYLKNSAWGAAKFIREEFGFNACIKDGRSFLFNKKELIAFNNALKERNVNLKRYMEYQRSEADFQKKLAGNKKETKGKKPYDIPNNLKDITTSPPPAPPVELVRQDLERLKKEFFEHKMSEYIDIYDENHAMMKFVYYWEKYIEKSVKRRCEKWCKDFNYANNALELITKKKEKFVPVKEEEMIRL